MSNTSFFLYIPVSSADLLSCELYMFHESLARSSSRSHRRRVHLEAVLCGIRCRYRANIDPSVSPMALLAHAYTYDGTLLNHLDLSNGALHMPNASLPSCILCGLVSIRCNGPKNASSAPCNSCTDMRINIRRRAEMCTGMS